MKSNYFWDKCFIFLKISYYYKLMVNVARSGEKQQEEPTWTEWVWVQKKQRELLTSV